MQNITLRTAANFISATNSRKPGRLLCALKNLHLCMVCMESIQKHSKIMSAKYLYQCSKIIAIFSSCGRTDDSIWLHFFPVLFITYQNYMWIFDFLLGVSISQRSVVAGINIAATGFNFKVQSRPSFCSGCIRY